MKTHNHDCNIRGIHSEKMLLIFTSTCTHHVFEHHSAKNSAAPISSSLKGHLDYMQDNKILVSVKSQFETR